MRPQKNPIDENPTFKPPCTVKYFFNFLLIRLDLGEASTNLADEFMMNNIAQTTLTLCMNESVSSILVCCRS